MCTECLTVVLIASPCLLSAKMFCAQGPIRNGRASQAKGGPVVGAGLPHGVDPPTTPARGLDKVRMFMCAAT